MQNASAILSKTSETIPAATRHEVARMSARINMKARTLNFAAVSALAEFVSIVSPVGYLLGICARAADVPLPRLAVCTYYVIALYI